jgi:hypothetical protein
LRRAGKSFAYKRLKPVTSTGDAGESMSSSDRDGKN